MLSASARFATPTLAVPWSAIVLCTARMCLYTSRLDMEGMEDMEAWLSVQPMLYALTMHVCTSLPVF